MTVCYSGDLGLTLTVLAIIAAGAVIGAFAMLVWVIYYTERKYDDDDGDE